LTGVDYLDQNTQKRSKEKEKFADSCVIERRGSIWRKNGLTSISRGGKSLLPLEKKRV